MQIKESSEQPKLPIKPVFGGKCIHGQDGARMVSGRLFNPNCKNCKRMEGAGR
jgi:hypothetical protein